MCQANFQTTLMDTPEAKALPDHLRGMVAPLSLWEYCFALQRRNRRLEEQFKAERSRAIDAETALIHARRKASK